LVSYEVYKLVHLVGIFLVLLGLGGLIAKAAKGDGRDHPWHKTASMAHGIGLFLIFLSGFGLLARLTIPWPYPGWVFVKLVLWLLLGGLVALVSRAPKMAKVYFWVTLVLSGTAAFFAIFKPF
jgi:hypothetical protein